MKVISVKFPTRCGSCNALIQTGVRAYWEKGKKPLCLVCGAAGKESVPSPIQSTAPAAKGKSGSKQYPHDMTVEWYELRPMIKAATSDNPKEEIPGFPAGSNCDRFRHEYSGASSWDGFTRGQMHRWVTEGYKTDAIQGLAGITPPMREKRRTRFVEDGDELHIDRVLGGDDNFMSIDTKREVIPGVRLNIELDASAASSEMLRDYQRWIAQTIYALETSGIDVEVNIFTLSRHLFANQRGIARQTVRVKKFGEVADFAGFSAMFSPGAFRGIMFSTFALHAERQGLFQTGYGSGVTNAWGCRFNPKGHSIDVACHWQATEFPSVHMTALLRTAITDMRTHIADN